MKTFTRTGMLAVAVALAAGRAQAQDCMLAEVKLFAGNFAPKNYAFAAGQIMAISQNTALFSLLGTTYGGNGQSTFALPDLRSRVPIGAGQGPGLSNYVIGQEGGAETVTETVAQMAPHTHVMRASSADATHIRPQGRVLAKVVPADGPDIYNPGPADSDMAPGTVSSTGGGQPQPNVPPYLGMNYIICIAGIYPSQN
jgi:microcystin-dependent protein